MYHRCLNPHILFILAVDQGVLDSNSSKRGLYMSWQVSSTYYIAVACMHIWTHWHNVSATGQPAFPLQLAFLCKTAVGMAGWARSLSHVPPVSTKQDVQEQSGHLNFHTKNQRPGAGHSPCTSNAPTRWRKTRMGPPQCFPMTLQYFFGSLRNSYEIIYIIYIN